MLKRRLGDSSIEVSVLGLGTVKFGRNRRVKYPHPYKLPSDGEVADLLAVAKSLGINVLDTAPAYGTSEERLGEAIQGARDDWLLCTKVGEAFDGVRSHFDFSATHALTSIERSLKRLRTGTLDLALVHADGRSVSEIEAAGAFAALRRLQREGVVRAVGLSGKGPADGSAALALSDVLMCTVNANYRCEVPLVAAAGEAGVGVLVKKPLASGHAADADAIPRLAALPGVTSVVVGTLNPEHLATNAAALSSPP